MTSQDARRAGRTLFEVTQARGDARPTLDGLLAVAALMDDHDELRTALLSPFVTPDAKRGIVGQLAATLGIAPAARQTLEVLASQHQLDGLAPLVRELKTLVHRVERRVDAEVTTAVALDEAQLGQLRDALASATGQQVTLTARVDPSVIGGVVARVGSVLYDGSLARQLARLEEQFVRQG